MSYIVTVLEKFHIICLIAGELSSHKTKYFLGINYNRKPPLRRSNQQLLRKPRQRAAHLRMMNLLQTRYEMQQYMLSSIFCGILH